MEDSEKIVNLLPTRRSVILGAALVPVASIRAAPQQPTSRNPAGRTSATPVSSALQSPNSSHVLSDDQRRILGAFVDRLVPKDDLGPAATECGVVEYIDGCLAGFLAEEKSALIQGLAAFEAFARTSQGAAFSDLPAEKQDAVLTAIDNNQAPALRPFFNRVRRLTLEGMFGDPSYGGNKNFAGWDLIRYPGAKLASSPQDQRMSTPATPYRKALYGGTESHGH